MTVIEIGSAVGAFAAAGAYVRWAVRPVLVAYWVGRRIERLLR